MKGLYVKNRPRFPHMPNTKVGYHSASLASLTRVVVGELVLANVAPSSSATTAIIWRKS